jgi:hypothetical protein
MLIFNQNNKGVNVPHDSKQNQSGKTKEKQAVGDKHNIQWWKQRLFTPQHGGETTKETNQ